ncbi:hypothetical protein EJ02DRAFT_96654 [Clathrospora elynae]|uniref:Uncharacterized protein n=1 Tax=Clathrospora elynae TaxID=706981 RepID=A0A6A5S8D1_9PLEO|nr:hypothetical protein EJ02DRAFT_96654 [Clathrospora elynae]
MNTYIHTYITSSNFRASRLLVEVCSLVQPSCPPGRNFLKLKHRPPSPCLILAPQNTKISGQGQYQLYQNSTKNNNFCSLFALFSAVLNSLYPRGLLVRPVR